MTHSNLSYRCYILPIIAAVVYVILSLPAINIVFKDWIPDPGYAILVKALILLVVLFLSCRLLDVYWYDFCHDEECTTALTNVCIALTDNQQNKDVSSSEIPNNSDLPPEIADSSSQISNNVDFSSEISNNAASSSEISNNVDSPSEISNNVPDNF